MAIINTIISALPLLIFLGVVYVVIRVSGILSSSTAQSRSALEKQGITYNKGRLSVKTDRAAPSQEEYIQKTQRKWEQGAKTLAARADAFAFGKRDDGSETGAGAMGGARSVSGTSSPGVQGQSSAVPTPEKRGFQRSKKLA